MKMSKKAIYFVSLIFFIVIFCTFYFLPKKRYGNQNSLYHNIKGSLSLSAFSTVIFIIVVSAKNNKDDYPQTNYICLGCKTTFPYNKKVCDKCFSLLEPEEGFYDRHPELKDKEENKETKKNKSENINKT